MNPNATEAEPVSTALTTSTGLCPLESAMLASNITEE